MSEEDVEFLKTLKMEEIKLEPNAPVDMPGFLSDEMIVEVDKILESQPENLVDPSTVPEEEKAKTIEQNAKITKQFNKEKRTKLYCIFQTQPQLFDALNEYLPEEYRLPKEINFLSQQIVKFPSEDSVVEKQLQLAPTFFKEYPEDIRRDAFQCLDTANIFGSPQEQQDLFDYLNFKSEPSTLQSYCPNRRLKPNIPTVQGRGNVPMQFQFVQEEDKRDLEDFQMLHSSFADRFKERIKKRFLELINIQYKQHHAKELAEVLQSLDQKIQKPSEIVLETAVSMLYFDKLDIVYAFQLMQQTGAQLKNQRFGWPTQYPVRNPELAVQNILTQTERRYQEQKARALQLNELYKNVFVPARAAFEGQGQIANKQWAPKLMEKNRIFVQENVQFYELRVADVQFTGMISIPKQLFDEGLAEKSPLHKQLMDQVLTQIQNIKQQKQQQKLQQQQQQQMLLQKKKEEEEPEIVVQTKKWKKCSQKRFVIKQKPEEKVLNELFVKAWKMNQMTVFDLDYFHQLMIGLCGEDLEYPPFYFEELQAKAGFGSQISLIKAPRQIYAVLLRFNFAGFDYVKKGQTLTHLLELHRLPCYVDGAMLEDNVDVFRLIDGEQQEAVAREKNTFLLPSLSISKEAFDRVINEKINFGDVLQECVDKCNFNQIHKNDLELLKCGPSCKHCVCTYLNRPCSGDCLPIKLSIDPVEDKKLKKDVADRIYKYGYCPLIFDYVNDQLRPGYILLSNQNLFRDDEDDPQTFTYVTKHPTLSFPESQDGKKKGYEELDECFYQFENYSTPNSYKMLNYASMIIQFVEQYFNSRPDFIRQQTRQHIDNGFSDYFSSRLDALMMPKDYVVQYNECYKEIKNQLLKANQSAKNVIVKFFERLQQPYDRYSPASDIIRNAFKTFSFRVLPSNFFNVKAISSFYNDKMLTSTDLIVLNHNLRSPDVIVEMLNEQGVDKEAFNYPMSSNPNIEVDISALKKDQILQKLQTFQKSYKQMPDDMFQLHQKQHDELFDKGIYEKSPYHKPVNFQETRQLANSVLNRGKYFTIPFGSEAHRQVETFEQEELQSELTTILEKSRARESIIKSQYIKWAGPTGAEAQVCHIEEEQLCYGLFRVRANCLMRILVSWMAVYTPSLLKFFDCNITTTALDTCPNVERAYLYRNMKETEMNQKPNNYFFNGEYQTALEAEEEEADEESVFFHAFSQDFDIAIQNIVQIYQSYSAIASSDELLKQCNVQNIQDFWQKNCYAPIQQWPFGDHFSSLPPPPHIPAILQYFLTQVYTTGDILDEMYKNPIVTIPIIARTIQHQVSLARHAEQRSAAVWRVLYPDAYYRSIDHATVFLNNVDKKFMQPKQLLHDLQRRIQDYESANNPNLSVDSQIDFCLPKVFDIVSFKQYFLQLQQQGICSEMTVRLKTNYFDRLAVTQQFFPMSKLVIPFRFTAAAYSACIQQLTDELDPELKEIGVNSFKRIFQNVFSADEEQYDNEIAKSILGKTQHEAIFDQVLQMYPNINLSLLFPSDVLKEYIEHARLELLNNKYKAEEIPPQDPQQLLFIEDLVYDIVNSDQLESDYSKQIYRDTTQSQVVEMLRQLKFDSPEASKFLKQKFETSIQQNKMLESLFYDNKSQKVQKDVQQLHTRYRQFSMPTVSDRSIYLIRACILGEKIAPEVLMKLFKGELAGDELKKFYKEKVDQQKMAVLEQFMKSSAANKSQAQQVLPQLQNDFFKKQMFDEVIIPIITQTEHKIRYFDNELYILCRMLAISCYRLEYCMKIVESLPDALRQAAVYGTRAAQPIPLSVQNQGNFGCSLFGNNLIQLLEEQQQRPVSKSIQDFVPLTVSQRIFNGHQPYAALINTADTSVNNCICGCITCPFCGGVGAGLNGTLSGSMNPRVAYSQMSEIDCALANGYHSTAETSVLSWDQMVMHDARQLKAADQLEQIQTFVRQNDQISLIYKLKPAIPAFENETHLLQVQFDKTKKPESRSKSRDTSKTEEEDFDVVEKLELLKRQTACSQYLAQNIGYRLQDTTLLPPPPDVYTAKFYNQQENAFTRQYMPTPGQKTGFNFAGMQELLETDQLVFDDPVDQMLLGECMVDGMDAFVKPGFEVRFQTSQRSLEQDVAALYSLLMTQQPSSQKDDYVSDQVFALLGTRGYPFLSLKKLFVQILKRLDGLASKVGSQHFDLVQMKFYRSSKCTVQNSLTTAVLMYNTWLSLQGLDALPAQFGAGLHQSMRDLKEPLYLVENYNGFVNLQQIQFDKK